MTPREWVEAVRDEWERTGEISIKGDAMTDVLAVLAAAVAWNEAMDAWADCELGTEAEALADRRIGGAAAMLGLAVTALPGEDGDV